MHGQSTVSCSPRLMSLNSLSTVFTCVYSPAQKHALILRVNVALHGSTTAFRSQHGNLFEFVCLTMKSSLGSRKAQRAGATRSPSCCPNQDASLNLASLEGAPHTYQHTLIDTVLYSNNLCSRLILVALISCPRERSWKIAIKPPPQTDAECKVTLSLSSVMHFMINKWWRMRFAIDLPTTGFCTGGNMTLEFWKGSWLHIHSRPSLEPFILGLSLRAVIWSIHYKQSSQTALLYLSLPIKLFIKERPCPGPQALSVCVFCAFEADCCRYVRAKCMHFMFAYPAH